MEFRMRIACTLAAVAVLLSPSTSSVALDTTSETVTEISAPSTAVEKAERTSLRKERKERKVKKDRSGSKAERKSKRAKAKSAN
jgi:hypothetical protein